MARLGAATLTSNSPSVRKEPKNTDAQRDYPDRAQKVLHPSRLVTSFFSRPQWHDSQRRVLLRIFNLCIQATSSHSSLDETDNFHFSITGFISGTQTGAGSTEEVTGHGAKSINLDDLIQSPPDQPHVLFRALS